MRNSSVFHLQCTRAQTAAAIAIEGLGRRAPHAAFAATREAARCTLLALGTRPARSALDDLRHLVAFAATSADDLGGKPREREAAMRDALAAVERLLPQGPAIEDKDPVPAMREAPARPRVLVVEDEYLIATATGLKLAEAGFDVFGPVRTGAEALAILEAACADGGMGAAVLDIGLPDGGAMRVADALVANGVPFLFATGYGPDYDKGAHSGAQVLLKPFDGSAIVGAVQALIAVDGQPGPGLAR